MNRLIKLLCHLERHDNELSSQETHNHKIGILGNADVGGVRKYESTNLDRGNNTVTHWERKIDALEYVLLRKKIMSAYELRYGIESLPNKAYLSITYYEKWMYSILITTLRKGLYSESELNEKYMQYLQEHNKYKPTNPSTPRFKINDNVRVRDIFDPEITNLVWRLAINVPEKQHVRTPGFIQNKSGFIESYVGCYRAPELASLNIPHNKCHLYRVRFKQKDIWNENDNFGEDDSVDMELMEHWLQPINEQDLYKNGRKDRDLIEHKAIDIEPTVSPYQIISQCVIQLLVEKGVITMNEIRKQIEFFDNKLYDNLGAKITIKAWRNPDWRAKLLDNSNGKNPYKLIRETFKEIPDDYYDTHLKVVQNTDKIHNVIVCTLCSCYPRQILGMPPDWYKSIKYRSEIVYKTRELLAKEFGCILDKEMVVRIHDSTSDLRYIVLPHLPTQIGTNWMHLTDKELESRITRDMMIGVCRYN